MTTRILRAVPAPLLLAGVLILTATSTAQPPSDVPVLPRQEVGRDDVRRAADWLKGVQNKGPDLSQFDPKLVEYAKKLIEKNPTATKEDFARELLGNQPHIDPAQLDALRRALEQHGGSSPVPATGPSGVPGPGTPPPGPRPQIPPPIPPGQLPLPRPADTERRPNRDGWPQAGPRPPELPPPGPGGDDLTRFRPEGRDYPGQPRGGDTDYARRLEQYKSAERFLERNFGPLDEDSELKHVLWELFTGRDASEPDSALSGVLDAASENGEGLFQAADSVPSRWKLPELGFGKWNLSAPSAPSAPSYSSPGGGSFSGFGGGDTSWLPVILLGAVAALALVLWWLWPMLTRASRGDPRPIPGLGPWPIDPRTITDRDGLVRAFEYLSVLVCGGDARVWNHLTIADELRRAVPDAADIADPLARLYALARYTPASELLPLEAIGDARRYLCRLAGVSAA